VLGIRKTTIWEKGRKGSRGMVYRKEVGVGFAVGARMGGCPVGIMPKREGVSVMTEVGCW